MSAPACSSRLTPEQISLTSPLTSPLPPLQGPPSMAAVPRPAQAGRCMKAFLLQRGPIQEPLLSAATSAEPISGATSNGAGLAVEARLRQPSSISRLYRSKGPGQRRAEPRHTVRVHNPQGPRGLTVSSPSAEKCRGLSSKPQAHSATPSAFLGSKLHVEATRLWARERESRRAFCVRSDGQPPTERQEQALEAAIQAEVSNGCLNMELPEGK